MKKILFCIPLFLFLVYALTLPQIPKESFHYFVDFRDSITFDTIKKIPLKVVWYLIDSDIDHQKRPSTFHCDERYTKSQQSCNAAYSHSGYDKGHMCDAADRSSSPERMYTTFIFTNICPQTPQLNRVTWEHLEAECRFHVKELHDTLRIECGPIGQQGHLLDGTVIPKFFYKIVDNQSDYHITVIMPNIGELDHDWHKYIISRDSLSILKKRFSL